MIVWEGPIGAPGPAVGGMADGIGTAKTRKVWRTGMAHGPNWEIGDGSEFLPSAAENSSRPRLSVIERWTPHQPSGQHRIRTCDLYGVKPTGDGRKNALPFGDQAGNIMHAVRACCNRCGKIARKRRTNGEGFLGRGGSLE